MTTNNNFSVLPFYKSVDEQDFRKNYAYGEVYPLFAKAGYMLPFQIIREHRNEDVSSVLLFRKDRTLVANVTTEMVDAGLRVIPFDEQGYDVIIFPAIFQVMNMQEGQFFLALSDGEETWFSEVFTSVYDMSGFIKVEWYNESNIIFTGGQVVFDNPQFHNFLYFASEIGKPEYSFEEEGENRDGYFFPSKQLSEKKYKFTILAPEYLCDAMRVIRMCDHVRVTDKYGRNYYCDNFLITPEWQEQGNLASVEVVFETDTIVKKIGTGMLASASGADYNDDYDEDYLTN